MLYNSILSTILQFAYIFYYRWAGALFLVLVIGKISVSVS